MISISYNSYLYITTFTFDKCCMEKKKEKKDLSREQDKMADILTCYMIVSRRIEQSPLPPPLPLLYPFFSIISTTITVSTARFHFVEWTSRTKRTKRARVQTSSRTIIAIAVRVRVFTFSLEEIFIRGDFFFFHSSYLINLKFDYFTHLVLEKVYRNLAWRKVWMQREMEIYI